MGMAISVSLTATTAAIGGTLPSMVQNARLWQPLMVYSFVNNKEEVAVHCCFLFIYFG